MKDKLIPKGSNALAKVVKSIAITNKLIKEIDSREVVPADDFRVPIPDENFRKYLLEMIMTQVYIPTHVKLKKKDILVNKFLFWRESMNTLTNQSKSSY